MSQFGDVVEPNVRANPYGKATAKNILTLYYTPPLSREEKEYHYWINKNSTCTSNDIPAGNLPFAVGKDKAGQVHNVIAREA
jgi:hypothetical protein